MGFFITLEVSFGTSLGLVLKSWHSTRKLGPSHAAFEPPRNGGRTIDDDEDDEFSAGDDLRHDDPLRSEMTAVRPSNVGGYCELKNKMIHFGDSA